MSFSDKINVLELLLELLKEHENKLDSLIEKMEIVEHTIKQNPSLSKPLINYEGTILEKVLYQQILVVDDDMNLANTFELILENVGFQVDIALTGQSALDQMAKRNYDLVLLDINLPDMLGYRVGDDMVDKYKSTEVIYITGHSKLKDGYETHQGEKDILMKPIEPDILIETAMKKLVEHVSPRSNKLKHEK